MILKIFSLYDAKTEAYMQPFFMHTKGAAIRAFTDLVNDGQSQVSKWPVDFVLFELGQYDDQSGNFISLPAPISVGIGIDFVRATD